MKGERKRDEGRNSRAERTLSRLNEEEEEGVSRREG